MRTLFIAGDSTVQSYTKNQYPQAGWGQMLYRFFKDCDNAKVYVRPDACGEHCVDYELKDFRIENHAIAARSSKSFIEQGRLDEIMKVAKPGDFLALQFGHNDANKEKEERFVPIDKFENWLEKYVDACNAKNIQCFFVTPVTMREFDSDGKCIIAFKEYRDAMIKAAEKFSIPYIDLSILSTNYISEIGPEKSKELYLWVKPGECPDGNFKEGSTDNAHFREHGAYVMASLIAEEIKRIKDPRLQYISSRLKQVMTLGGVKG